MWNGNLIQEGFSLTEIGGDVATNKRLEVGMTPE
jgi:hypothetical protein